MTKHKEIIIDITSEEISVDLEGFQGKGCEAVQKAFSDMGTVKEHRKKPEYFQNNKPAARVTAKR